MSEFRVLKQEGSAPVFMFDKAVPAFEEQAVQQLRNTASLPFVTRIAAMPDTHLGYGATIGSVVATHRAIIPACVGVDIGCGMDAVRTTLTANDLPDNLFGVRSIIEQTIPHGGVGVRAGYDPLALPEHTQRAWKGLVDEFEVLFADHQKILNSNHRGHLGSLGTGNHFIEVCLDEADDVWIMLHSGSRGVGNIIGRTFIKIAQKEMERWCINLPDKDLAYLPEGSEHYGAYCKAVNWAQEYALQNRNVMMARIYWALRESGKLPEFDFRDDVVSCHHNYVSRENHGGRNVHVTRKGAVRARKGDLCIIPGSMGTRSYICEGLSGEGSLDSCSHGAGRAMSRTKARNTVSLAAHEAALQGVECNATVETLDETPSAYKDIDAVMASQRTLVRPIHTLRQIVCVKG